MHRSGHITAKWKECLFWLSGSIVWQKHSRILWKSVLPYLLHQLLSGIAWGWRISRFRLDTRRDKVQISSRVMNLSTGWVQSLSRISMVIIRDYSEIHSSAACHSHCEWHTESPGHMTARRNSHRNHAVTSKSEILWRDCPSPLWCQQSTWQGLSLIRRLGNFRHVGNTKQDWNFVYGFQFLAQH